jgi:hypothetical protein
MRARLLTMTTRLQMHWPGAKLHMHMHGKECCLEKARTQHPDMKYAGGNQRRAQRAEIQNHSQRADRRSMLCAHWCVSHRQRPYRQLSMERKTSNAMSQYYHTNTCDTPYGRKTGPSGLLQADTGVHTTQRLLSTNTM